MACNEDLKKGNGAYPRTCADCGLGPCKKYLLKMQKAKEPPSIPSYEIVSFSDLTANEKDQLLQAIVEHLGRDIARIKYDGEPEGTVELAQRRS